MADAVTGEDKQQAPKSALHGLWRELSVLFAPKIFAWLTGLAGIIVLIALITPSAAERLPGGLPLPLLEASHFLSSLAGTLLLILSFGIRQRLHAAWLIAVIVFFVLAATSFLAGQHIVLALAMAFSGLGLIVTRRAFYRRGSLSRLTLSPEPMIMLVLLLAGIAWLGFFAYRNVQYRDDLWWTFAADADASRFLRALVVITATAVLFLFWKLLQPPDAPGLPDRTDELDERLKDVVTNEATPQPEAALAFLPDKRFVFSDNDAAFAMYGVRGRNWIVMGPPMGPHSETRPLAFKLMQMADQARAKLFFYAVPTSFLPIALDLGLSARKIGETAVIPLTDFTLEGPARARMRQALSRIKREGCRFEMLPAGSFAAHGAQMKEVSDAWLAHHSGTEKAFTLGRFDPDYLDRYPVASIWREDTLLAFANVWQSGDGKALSIDLMRNRPDAPPATMDALFTDLALWGQANGAETLDLGMAPLSGLAAEREANTLSRLGNLVYSHGEEVYGFEGLRRYKDKFGPRWEPLYLCGPDGQNLALALADVAILTSGGLFSMLKPPKES